MIQLSKEPLTREIAQILLDDAWRSIDEALTTLQEIVGGVIVDLEHNEPLPYPKEGRA